MKYIFLFIIMTLSRNAAAQVVNIEAERIKGKDTTGWFGTLGTNVNWLKNTKSILQVEGSAHVQHNSARGIWLLVGRSSVLQADNDALTNETFAHLRYTHRLNKWLRAEAFTQVQNNIVTRIKLRALGGVGLRFKLAHSKKMTAYAGTGYLYEYTEQATKPSVSTLREHRSTNYFTATWRPTSTVDFTTTTYFQPLLEQQFLNDFRLTGEYKLGFKITKHLGFNTQFRFLYDTQPAPEAPNSTFAWLNGLNYAF